jgi:hypothetical protein
VILAAFRFGPEIPDQSRPVLPFRPLLLRKKGRLAAENWAARKAAIHDASNSPGSGGVWQGGTGAANSARCVVAGVAPPVWPAAWQRRTHQG